MSKSPCAPAYPEGRAFAFTIVDDTDGSTVENVGPVYELLHSLGMRTTKTLWVYPSRDHFGGGSLSDPPYLQWLRGLQAKGFELALHSVGSGSFARQEILDGLERFREAFGDYPTIQVNHAANPDCLYWSPARRFPFPFSLTYGLFSCWKRLRRSRTVTYSGEAPGSPHFWGDAAKAHVKYVRNLTFNGINTLAYDPRMPYKVRAKEKYSNYWFSSSDGHTVEEFSALVAPRNVGRLVRERGACIVYTHFSSGFVRDGEVVPEVESGLRHLASQGGWFVPAGRLLDHLLASRADSSPPGYGYLLRLSAIWHRDRIVKYACYRR